MLTADNMFSPNNQQKFQQRPRMYLFQKPKINFAVFIAFLKSTQKFVYLQKNHQLDSLNISEVIDSEKCSYLNAKKQLFQKTIRDSPSWRVPNTAQICMAVLLS